MQDIFSTHSDISGVKFPGSKYVGVKNMLIKVMHWTITTFEDNICVVHLCGLEYMVLVNTEQWTVQCEGDTGGGGEFEDKWLGGARGSRGSGGQGVTIHWPKDRLSLWQERFDTKEFHRK